MEASKIPDADLIDLVFEGRNKAYGAYQLRKNYHRRVWIALAITGSFTAFLFFSLYISDSLSRNQKAAIEVKEIVIEEIEEKEQLNEPPPPPAQKQEVPKVEVTRFTIPVVVNDDEVKDEDIPPVVTDLEGAKIAAVSETGGIDERIIIPPPDLTEGEGMLLDPEPEDENTVHIKVEVDAAFPGGINAWKNYLQKNLSNKVPMTKGAPPGFYTVVIQFIVDRHGNISDVKGLTSQGYGMEEEAVRVIRQGPKWTPAIQKGRSVSAYRKQPITFMIGVE